MNREQFILRRRNDWQRFQHLLDRAESKLLLQLSGKELSELAALYRALCYDLSLVQSREWGDSMHRFLNGLVARGHNVLYRTRPGSLRNVLNFVGREFPQLLRANIAYFWIALILSTLPGAVCGVVVARNPAIANRILNEDMQREMEASYSESIAGRNEGTEGFMAGFYVRNNVGIAFKCFALGALAGIGTAGVLLYNSIYLGTVTGFLIGKGHWDNFLEFVIGHGSFELTAIVVSGAAGLMIGHAMIHPGQRTIWESLQVRGKDAVRIALGAGFMLVVAAVIEGFWSPSRAPREVKLVMGAVFWGIVFAYLTFAGRGEPAGEQRRDSAAQESTTTLRQTPGVQRGGIA